MPPWWKDQVLGLLALLATLPAPALLCFRAYYLFRRRLRAEASIALGLAAATLLVHVPLVRLTMDSVHWLIFERYRPDSRAVFSYFAFSENYPEQARKLGVAVDTESLLKERFRFLRGGIDFYLAHRYALRPMPRDEEGRRTYVASLSEFLARVQQATADDPVGPGLRTAEAPAVLVAAASAPGERDARTAQLSRRIAALLDQDFSSAQSRAIWALQQEYEKVLFQTYYGVDRRLFRDARGHVEKLIPLPSTWQIRHHLQALSFAAYILLHLLWIAFLARELPPLYRVLSDARALALLTDNWSDDLLRKKARSERLYILAAAEKIRRAARRKHPSPGWRDFVCLIAFGVPGTRSIWWRQQQHMPMLLSLVEMEQGANRP